MPATRRKAANPTATSRVQPTLSFKNKITKPSTATTEKSSKAHNLEAAKLANAIEISTPSPPTEVIDSQIPEQPTTAELNIRSQVRAGEKETTAAEERASQISSAQIKRYWKKKEDERRAPRVHQQDLSMEEKILREFDLSYQFGPCIGIARSKRWKRADTLGLKPPIEVLAVLLKEDSKNPARTQRAYVDELMGSNFISN
ncbi:hypothetical protein MMC19_002252 [Ptychographa xylographoides]|nr:hypothetical protein [Ptychographa xylographoides]